MRAAAILTGPVTHLDHLGVLSSLLDIPLIVTEDGHMDAAERFYPNLHPQMMSLEELSLQFLAENYDLLLGTGRFFASELDMSLRMFFGKKMRFVFCPHGNSDKDRCLTKHPDQDIALVYGDHLKDLAIKTGASKKIRHFLKTGNYRYDYYLQHRAFFDDLADACVFSKFQKERPIILYAPTWQDHFHTTSFFLKVDETIGELAGDYHLLIKLHPSLAEDPAVLPILKRYEPDPSVRWVTELPFIYPLLNKTAIYIGDYSSIGYDFLHFDRPLYFFNPSKNDALLHCCGLVVPEGIGIGKFIKETVAECASGFSRARGEMYRYAFGKERPSAEIKGELFQILSSSAVASSSFNTSVIKSDLQ